MGRPLEKSLDYAIKYTPSKQFKSVLIDVKNSLETGTDFESSLKVTLKEMADQHILEIKEYGKKLNPMTIFYMIFGTIVPSLGVAVVTVGLSFAPEVQVTELLAILLLLFLTMIQAFFILLFKSYQPNVDL